MAAERALPRVVVVAVEVRHDELADRPIDGRAETEPGEFRGRDSAPESAVAVDREDVVVVTIRLEIDDERWSPVDAECGGREDRALGAVRGTVVEHPPRRAARRPVRLEVIVERIEEALHACGRLEGTKGAHLTWGEAEHAGMSSRASGSLLSQQRRQVLCVRV